MLGMATYWRRDVVGGLRSPLLAADAVVPLARNEEKVEREQRRWGEAMPGLATLQSRSVVV